MNFSKGDRVRHPGKPEWDMGQVLEDCTGQDVRVYFTGAGEKKLRLDYVTLQRVEGADAANPVLDSLGKRQPRTAAAGAKRGKKERKTRSIEQLAEDFTRLFPAGFHDDKFQREERDGKVKAHETLADQLGQEKLDALIAAGDHAEVGRRALGVIAATNLVFPREAISLKNGLKDESNARLFAESLRSLLYGEAEVGSRFAAFSDTLSTLGAAKWPLATYFPFVAFPEREMFLKPTVTRKVAEMLGFELNYSVEPNWLTYSKLLEMSRHIFDSLAELRPRDMFDIQSFISRVASYEEGEQAEGETAARAATETPNAPAAAKAADAPTPDAEDAGEPPWATDTSDSQSGAAETSDERATSSEAASESDEAAPSPNEASENEASDNVGANTQAESSEDAGAESDNSESADASGAGAQSVAGEASDTGEETNAGGESGAGGEGREGAAAAD